MLCQPKGGKARLTEGKTFINGENQHLRRLTGELTILIFLLRLFLQEEATLKTESSCNLIEPDL